MRGVPPVGSVVHPSRPLVERIYKRVHGIGWRNRHLIPEKFDPPLGVVVAHMDGTYKGWVMEVLFAVDNEMDDPGPLCFARGQVAVRRDLTASYVESPTGIQIWTIEKNRVGSPR